MELTMKNEAVRYVEMGGQEFRFTRILQQMKDLRREGRLLDPEVTERMFFSYLAGNGLVEHQWFGRETGHGYVIRDRESFESLYQELTDLKTP